jgi:hypothetical protein
MVDAPGNNFIKCLLYRYYDELDKIYMVYLVNLLL